MTEKGPKQINMLKNLTCITTSIILEGIEKVKSERSYGKTTWAIARACERAKIHLSSPKSPFFPAECATKA